jgi:hypothetical protein
MVNAYNNIITYLLHKRQCTGVGQLMKAAGSALIQHWTVFGHLLLMCRSCWQQLAFPRLCLSTGLVNSLLHAHHTVLCICINGRRDMCVVAMGHHFHEVHHAAQDGVAA